MSAPVAMVDPVREMLLAAVSSAKYGVALPAFVVSAIENGDPDLLLSDLGFDSLALMEFCISVELQSKAELTPLLVGEMTYFREVEAWLRVRLA